MKFDSPLFDRIRVKPTQEPRKRPNAPVCQWKGCSCEATHRAPKGRDRENEYWRFCLAHVREYNASYNYFAGMSDEAVTRYQKDALTGHRPTWKMGPGGTGRGADPDQAQDPFGMFHEFSESGSRHRAAPEPARTVHNAERKALDAMGLEPGATTVDVKARFKLLVKRHHPDANGGDRSCEERLREIIQAYNYLKSVGYT